MEKPSEWTEPKSGAEPIERMAEMSGGTHQEGTAVMIRWNVVFMVRELQERSGMGNRLFGNTIAETMRILDFARELHVPGPCISAILDAIRWRRISQDALAKTHRGLILR